VKDIKKIHINDEDYPKMLKAIHFPPEALYVRGGILPQDDIAVALVGSRKASIYGSETCERLAYELASRGITVVSGLARGIDTAAHRGALKAGGRTIAVFGCGVDYIYPPENKKLAGEIEKSGALVSEFKEGVEPFPANFPKRNRIISGFSLGVVVVEAAQKSGALITANFALDENREVFAVPGKVGSTATRGVHNLIKEGAKLVDDVNDIIEELNIKVISDSEPGPGARIKLEKTESRIYSLLSDDPMYIDDIIRETKLSSPEVSGILLKLQLRKLVKELPGKLFYK